MCVDRTETKVTPRRVRAVVLNETSIQNNWSADVSMHVVIAVIYAWVVRLESLPSR